MPYQEICLFEWYNMLSEVTEDSENNEHLGYLVTMRSNKFVRNVVKNRWLFRHQAVDLTEAIPLCIGK